MNQDQCSIFSVLKIIYIHTRLCSTIYYLCIIYTQYTLT